MANNAADQLNRNPINEDVLRVFGYLFQNTEDVRNQKVKGELFPFSIRTRKGSYSLLTISILGVFQSIVGMSNEVDKDISDPTTTVRVLVL